VSSEGITIDPEKLKAARKWPTLKNKHEIRCFLGLCTHYRWFTHISRFANDAKPLSKLMEEKQAFQWTPEVEAAFQTLKEALCTAHILAYPSLTRMQVMSELEEWSPKYRMDRSE
jgi:hypothetical protein